ncbi:phage tail protein [Hafnia alvei]|uniref:tail fiber assembly protein n=1 Tax=Hafnia alvei TaxID=569 RepID=UPI0007BCC0AB|nr:tail fiber assembly protein [Hafnia alvei]ANC42593.1 phage tail protein [Hafnia alvei]
MKTWFSPSTVAFYPDSLKESYKAAGSFPDDVTEVSEEAFAEFSGTPPEGKQRGVDKGLPCWVDLPATVVTLDQQKSLARSYRDAFIASTDRLLVADYSIGDNQMTESQRAELIAIRETFKKWPLVEEWPFVELPDIPQWLLIEAVNNGYIAYDWPLRNNLK